MIKNASLFSILILILGFTYYWEELEIKKVFNLTGNEEKIILFNTSDVIEMTLKNTKLFKENGKWIVGDLNYRANEYKVQFILKTLNGIIKTKKIENIDELKTKEFFKYQDHSFSIKTFKNEITFRLGDISSITGEFYIEKYELGQKELYLCRDINVYDGLYKNELEAEYQKYIYLKDLISSEPMQLISKSLLAEFELSKIRKIKIDNTFNRWFEVDFEKQVTNPLPYEGVDYISLNKALENLWKTVTVNKMFEVKGHILSNLLSTIELTNNAEEKIILKLYGLLDGNDGYFVKISTKEKIFKLDEKARLFFFANVQDFWDKRLNFRIDLTLKDRLDFQLSDDAKEWFDFYVDDLEKFEIKSKVAKSTNTANMNLLFNLLFSLTDFKEAKYIAKESKPYKLKKGEFRLYTKLLGKSISIIFKESMIIVTDLDFKVEYFYPHKNKAINILNLKDFFDLNSN